MPAFTTRIPLAVLIVCGVKRWENRAMMPSQPRGRCAMSCSKGSDAREYANFLAWARTALPDVCDRFPAWPEVAPWRGKLVAVCDYEAMLQPDAPDARVWNEGYSVWWKLANLRLLPTPIPCRGNVGMWETGRTVF